MRLRSITLRNFRGVQESRVEFGDAVTVIEGPNEIGKSSIAEALRLIRSEKDSSQKACVRAVQPVGSDVGPEVEIELATGDYVMTYRKRWLRSKLSELHVSEPEPEQLTGEQAHNRFREILENTVDLDLLEALDVVQGGSLDQPELARVNALHRALDDGAKDNGEQDGLLSRIEDEYARFFTRTGKTTGRFKELAGQVEQLTSLVDELEARSKELDAFTDEHAQTLARREDLVAELARAQTELEAAQQADAHLATLREAAAQARRELVNAQNRVNAAADARKAREALVDQLDRRAATATESAASSARLGAALQQAESALTEAQERVTALEIERREAHRTATTARAARDLRVVRTSRDRLEAQLGRARTAEAQRRKATALLGNAPIDDEQLARLTDLDAALLTARKLRDAAAAHVTIQSLGDHPVTVDGAPLLPGGGHESTVLSVVRIEAEGVLSVEVSPGTSPVKLERNLRSAQQALDEALAENGVDSLDQARVVAARRAGAQAALDRAEASLEALLEGEDLAQLEEKLAALDAQLEQSTAEQSDAPLDALQEQAEAAGQAEEHLGDQLEAASTALDEARKAAERARDAAVRAEAAAEASERELDAARDGLATARETHDDASLVEAAQVAQADMQRVQESAMAAAAAVEAANPDVVSMDLTNAEELVSTRTERRNTADKRLAQLKALIDDRTRDGIYDDLEKARAGLDSASTEHARLGRAAAAVALLRQTMLRHREAAQQRYVAPFRDHMEHLGRVVFGSDFQVEISPELTVESRTLGGCTVPFGSLSAGTREQIALLGRLASAQLVDGAEGAPVILDDSLGFADPMRLRRLNVVLNDVGHCAQVIILTCQPDRFGAIGGAKVVQLTGAPAQP